MSDLNNLAALFNTINSNCNNINPNNADDFLKMALPKINTVMTEIADIMIDDRTKSICSVCENKIMTPEYWNCTTCNINMCEKCYTKTDDGKIMLRTTLLLHDYFTHKMVPNVLSSEQPD